MSYKDTNAGLSISDSVSNHNNQTAGKFANASEAFGSVITAPSASKSLGSRIKPLRTTWSRNDRDYTVIDRKGNVVLVKAKMGDGTVMSYEVAKIRVRDPHPHDSGEWDQAEKYPGATEWGKLGWTWQNRSSAEIHFAFLVKHGVNKDFFASDGYREIRRRNAQSKREYEASWRRNAKADLQLNLEAA